MKRASIFVVSLMCSVMLSAQTETKYYMNVQTAPDEVQSYEINSDLKVSWEPTQKGATPSGYYSKDEVDAMLQNMVDDLSLKRIKNGAEIDRKYVDEVGLIDKANYINCLLCRHYYMDEEEQEMIYNTVFQSGKGSVLERLDNLEAENKNLKDRIDDLESRLAALEEKK